jgi:hypothetical protein
MKREFIYPPDGGPNKKKNIIVHKDYTKYVCYYPAR